MVAAMVDLDERVERAARAFDPESFEYFHAEGTCFNCDENRKVLLRNARAAMEAAFPEMFSKARSKD